ncbi:hypothetical protein Trco_003655 [Trichoderma cornu-damae]|uniref:Uncharacterized protein n=1 Tax=Trichoderma cornu-damae TaxID=654480 RepID=A0A9P8TWS5_9HYPO|nr:hypothetical protein Trco_003655 [Trichoderma cornu-damae]
MALFNSYHPGFWEGRAHEAAADEGVGGAVALDIAGDALAVGVAGIVHGGVGGGADAAPAGDVDGVWESGVDGRANVDAVGASNQVAGVIVELDVVDKVGEGADDALHDELAASSSLADAELAHDGGKGNEGSSDDGAVVDLVDLDIYLEVDPSKYALFWKNDGQSRIRSPSLPPPPDKSCGK